MATRGIKVSELAQSRVWKEGPQFVLENETNWPARVPGMDTLSSDTKEECRMVRTSVTQVLDSNELNPKNFSDFRRLVRVTAWVRRFTSNCKCRPEQRDLSKSLSIEEVKKAEFYWFQDTKGRKSLENLNPMKDEDGLLHIDGHLHHAEVPYESKHPVILPKEHPITELVVRAVHEQLGHGSGVEHTLSELRSRFWVIRGRAVVRIILNHCQVSKKRFAAKPVGQMMASLPRPRVISSIGKSREKIYLCLFTCLVTRAVHLEMAYALDTGSFMNAFAGWCHGGERLRTLYQITVPTSFQQNGN